MFYSIYLQIVDLKIPPSFTIHHSLFIIHQILKGKAYRRGHRPRGIVRAIAGLGAGDEIAPCLSLWERSPSIAQVRSIRRREASPDASGSNHRCLSQFVPLHGGMRACLPTNSRQHDALYRCRPVIALSVSAFGGASSPRGGAKGLAERFQRSEQLHRPL